MILLDTNVIFELMRPKPDENVVIWLDNQKGKAVWVCSITRAEILAGLAMMPEGKRKQGLMDAAASMFDEDFETGACHLIAMQRIIMQISFQNALG